MENKEFDEFIREGLERYQLDSASSDWGQMENLLDKEALLDQQFDQFVAEGLGKLPLVSLPSSDWTVMEQLLDKNLIMTDENFDQFVKERIDKNPTYSDQSDWVQMEGVLDQREREGKELLYIKGIELILVIMAIFTMFQFYPTDVVTSIPFADLNENVVKELPVINSESKIEKKTDITEKASSNTKPIPSNKNTVPLVEKNTKQKNIKTVIQKEIIPNKISIVSSKENIIVETNSILPFNAESTTKFSTNNIVQETIDLIQNENNLIEKDKILKEEIVEEKNSIESLRPIASVELNKLNFNLLPEQFKIVKNKPIFRMGVYTSYDWNYVMTPYKKEVGSSYQSGHHGFSGGFTASVLKGNLELETGLKYIRKSYNPIAIYEVTGSADEGFEALTLDKLTFNIISLPVNMKYYFPLLQKWKFYASVGGTFNTVAWSDYNRYKMRVTGSRNPDNILESKGVKKQSVQTAGFFDNESLKDNYFLSANLGIGVERKVDEKTSFFVQPNFSYYIMPADNGLGPNKDRINTLSVDIGLKYDF